MITIEKLRKCVEARKQELAAEKGKLTAFSNTVSVFISNIKSHSAIYPLIKNLSVFKELENLISDSDTE